MLSWHHTPPGLAPRLHIPPRPAVSNNAEPRNPPAVSITRSSHLPAAQHVESPSITRQQPHTSQPTITITPPTPPTTHHQHTHTHHTNKQTIHNDNLLPLQAPSNAPNPPLLYLLHILQPPPPAQHHLHILHPPPILIKARHASTRIRPLLRREPEGGLPFQSGPGAR